jgi:beta-phosphoglucomutase-like phosphatase (HAD superfamily)
MDGTLVDSTAGVVGAWSAFAKSYPGINVEDILSCSHGVRTVENLQKYCKINDQDELEREATRFEEAIVTTAKEDGRPGIVKLPGVSEIMEELLPGSKYPKPCWAICTSATRAYATSALNMAGVPIPDAFVAAEDVTVGKPSPDPYLLGAKKCNVNPERCLVIEDAPTGIRSGSTAGCKTLALLTTHSREQLMACQPDFLAKDLSRVTVKRTENGVEVIIDNLE